MNMSDINCFMKVAEFMSFSKAAEALFISQQAVSIHVKRLEEEYNVQLFERKPSLRITEEGKLLLEAARDIIQREEELYDQLNYSRSNYRGSISIGLPPNRSSAFAAEFVPKFAEAYPNMSVKLIESPSTLLPTAVRQNDIDLALPFVLNGNNIADSGLFNSIPMPPEKIYVVIPDRLLQKHFPNRYPACKTEFLSGLSLEDIVDIPMFLRPSVSPMHAEIVSLLSQKGFTPLIKVETNLTSAHLSLCVQGFGIFFCPPMLLKYMYREQPQHFRTLNVFPVNELHNKRRAMLIYHKRKHLTKPLRDSMEIIRENYNMHKIDLGRYNPF